MWHSVWGLVPRRGTPDGRLNVESFGLSEPYWTMRLGLVPFWKVSNMEPSADRLQRFLEARPRFEEIALTLFAHGIDSVGLPPFARWQALISSARRSGRLICVNARAYPAHFSVSARYQSCGSCKLHPLPSIRCQPERRSARFPRTWLSA